MIGMLILGKKDQKGHDETGLWGNDSKWLLGTILPPFQRPVVWNEERMVKFIESAWLGMHLGTFVVNNTSDVPYEDDSGLRRYHPTDLWLIDGQQRLTAVDRYLDDVFPVFGAYWSEVTATERRRFSTTSFSSCKVQIKDERMRAGDLDAALSLWFLRDPLAMENGMACLEEACTSQSWMLAGREALAQVFAVPVLCPPEGASQAFVEDLEYSFAACGVAEGSIRLLGFVPPEAWGSVNPGHLRGLVLQALGVEVAEATGALSLLVSLPPGGPAVALVVRLADVEAVREPAVHQPGARGDLFIHRD